MMAEQGCIGAVPTWRHARPLTHAAGVPAAMCDVRGRGVENEQKYALKCFNWQLAAGSWQESTDVKPLAACSNATPSTNTASSATPQGIVVTTTSPTSTASTSHTPGTGIKPGREPSCSSAARRCGNSKTIAMNKDALILARMHTACFARRYLQNPLYIYTPEYIYSL